MTSATIARILQQYGLSAVEQLPVEKGYRNESHPVRLPDNRLVNIILYKHEPDILQTIRRIHRVSLGLAQQGLPVRSPLEDRVLQLHFAGGVRYAALYNYLPGSTINWEAYTRKHLKLLGKTMCELRIGLRRLPRGDTPSVAQQYGAMVQRMQQYFADPAVVRALATKLHLATLSARFAEQQRLLQACDRLGQQQLLHMDLVRSNILFHDQPELAVAGILDFEKLAYGHPLFDIARTLAFLLVDCKYKPADKVQKYFIRSGYERRGQQISPRVRLRSYYRDDLLEALVDLFLFYDFYKFLLHNPYEYLPDNEHFVRTRDLLLRRGVITTTPTV